MLTVVVDFKELRQVEDTFQIYTLGFDLHALDQFSSFLACRLAKLMQSDDIASTLLNILEIIICIAMMVVLIDEIYGIMDGGIIQ